PAARPRAQRQAEARNCEGRAAGLGRRRGRRDQPGREGAPRDGGPLRPPERKGGWVGGGYQLPMGARRLVGPGAVRSRGLSGMTKEGRLELKSSTISPPNLRHSGGRA